MGTKSGIFQIDDFSGGLVTKGSVIKLEPKMTPKCMNVYSTVFGTLKKRLGYGKLNSGTTSATCRGLYTFIKSSASKFLIGKFGAGLHKMDAGAAGWDGTWDSVTLDSTITAADNMYFDVFKKGGEQTLIFTTDERTDLMQAWTGTGNTSVIAGAPKAKFIKVWMNHVWAANCEAFILLDGCEVPWAINQTQIDDCDAAWTTADSTNVTCAIEATDYKEGTGAAKATVTAGDALGLIAYKTIASTDMSAYKYITFWAKCTVDAAAGDFTLGLDDTAAGASPIESYNLPALVAGTWKLCTLTITTPGSMTAIISLALTTAVHDLGALTITLDDIRLTKTAATANLGTSVDYGDSKVGDFSLAAEVAIGFSTGLVNAKALSLTLDLSSYTSIDFWIKSSVITSAGDVRILLDDSVDCSSGASSKEYIAVPVLAADTWTYCSVALGTPATDTAIKSLGLYLATDLGAQTIHLDNVRATFTEPDRISRSAVLYYDDWNGSDSGYEDIFTAQDSGLTGLQELKASLYVFKRKSVHRISYLGGRPLLKVEQVKSTIGTISPRTIANVDVPAEGEYCIFLGSDRQIYLFDGYNSAPVSEPIQTDNGYSDVYMNNINCTTGIDAALDMCHAINLPDYHWYVLFCPQGAAATACTHAIVYDYLAKAFWSFDTQAFTASWVGDNGIGTDTPYVGGINYAWKWNSGNNDDTVAIDSYWESMKLSASKQGRPMLKKARYVEGNSKVNSTYEMTFSYRNNWAASYTSTENVVQSANQWTRDISQVENLLQVRVEDSTTTAPYELFSLDFVGEDMTIGR